MLNIASNNPVLKNATFPHSVQLKALKALKKKSQRIPSSLQSQNSPLHLSRQDGFRRMIINPNCSGDLSYITPQPTHLSRLKMPETYYRPENFSLPLTVWSPRAVETP